MVLVVANPVGIGTAALRGVEAQQRRVEAARCPCRVQSVVREFDLMLASTELAERARRPRSAPCQQQANAGHWHQHPGKKSRPARETPEHVASAETAGTQVHGEIVHHCGICGIGFGRIAGTLSAIGR